MMETILKELNEKQKEAVLTTDGPLLIMAGAGSGKTKTLTTRVAYLINKLNIQPQNILAITFTNKAAKEMKERITNIIGNKAHYIQISTFHSFGLKIMKENYIHLDYEKNFTILDADDTLTLIKKIMKELNISTENYNPRYIKEQISGAKNQLINAKEYSIYCNTDIEQKVEMVYNKYEKKLKLTNSVDFDDLLMLPIVLFKKYPDVLKNYQEQYKYILIDEYQDTNEAQYLLSKMISAKYKNICVVGDADQSIYSWRGANYKNILNFEKDYNNAKTIYLEENYRSTNYILDAANNVIKNNKQRKEKSLWTEIKGEHKIVHYKANDEKEEAYYVYTKIKKLINDGISKKNIAVLYRTNAQSRNVEELLLRENIPYKVVGSFYFYNRSEIKDLIAYLKLINNPSDDLSLLRIINVPKRGIGLKSIEKIVNTANEANTTIYKIIEEFNLSFKNTINKLIEEKNKTSLTEFIELVFKETKLIEKYEQEKTLESEIKIENLKEFKSIAKNFEEKNGIISLENFLDEISLVADSEEYKYNDDTVFLMSVHSSKGLEFDAVFLIGMEEGLFPHKNSLDSQEKIEEERRLCYVAITRAKKQLWVINARKRLLYGMDRINQPSRFILEMKDDIMNEESNEIIKEPFIDQTVEYSIGEKIIHSTLGEGIVVKVENDLIHIAFPHPIGIKTLLKGHQSIRKEK